MAAVALAIAVAALVGAGFAGSFALLALLEVRRRPNAPSLAVPSAVADLLAHEFSQPEEDNTTHLLIAPNFAACGKITVGGVTDLDRPLVTCGGCNEWLEVNRGG